MMEPLCLKSELDLFSGLPIQVAIENSDFEEVHPIATLSDGPIEFYIPGTFEHYIDPSFIFLQLAVKISKRDGSAITATDKVGPINYLLNTAFENVEVFLNEKQIVSQNNYGYRSILDALLNFPENAQKTFLKSSLFEKDTAKYFDETDPNGNNLGLKARHAVMDLNKEITLFGAMNLDLSFQHKLLLNGVSLKIRLPRAKNSFVLMSNTQGFVLKITKAFLLVLKVTVSPSVVLAHNKTLENGVAKYPILKNVKTLTIASGTHSTILPNLFLGPVSNRIVIGFVTNGAYSGDFTKNPFNFQNFNINYISLKIGQRVLPNRPLTPQFSEGEFYRSYVDLFSNMGRYLSSGELNITPEEFQNGLTLFAFDTTPDLCASDLHSSATQNSNISLEVKFSSALTSTINVILYSEFQSEIHIDKLRQKDIWDAIEPGFPRETSEKQKRKDSLALSVILLAVEDSFLDDIGDCKRAIDAWQILEDIHTKYGLLHILQLLREIFNIVKRNDEDMKEYFPRIMECHRKLAKCHHGFGDGELALIMLLGLPKSYEPLILSLEQQEEKLSTSVVKSKLLLEEKRQKQRQIPQEDPNCAFAVLNNNFEEGYESVNEKDTKLVERNQKDELKKEDEEGRNEAAIPRGYSGTDEEAISVERNLNNLERKEDEEQACGDEELRREDEGQNETIIPRRSSRIAARQKEYCRSAFHRGIVEHKSHQDEMPSSYEEALNMPKAQNRLRSIECEMASLREQRVWDVDLPGGVKRRPNQDLDHSRPPMRGAELFFRNGNVPASLGSKGVDLTVSLLQSAEGRCPRNSTSCTPNFDLLALILRPCFESLSKITFNHIHVKCNSTCVRSVVMNSNREFENRAAIIVALRAGRSPKERVDFLKLPKTTIYRVKKQFDEADSNKEGIATRKKHSRRSDRSYALRKGQLLTENMKNNRKGKAAALLNNLKHDSFGMLRFFSDENNFDVDQKVNPRNDRWICKDPSEIPVVMHTKFPASVMVLGVISSEGDVMPPHFFEKGLRMNADTYINVLETVVKPWMDMVAAGRKYVFQQDSAPAHKAKKTQSWLTLNVPSHWGPDIWPPNSPDCNPLDYYVWGVVERDVNKAPHTTIQSVKKAVHTVMTQMDKVIVAKACASFRTRLETVVANNGNFIE
ncbi:hypothetical protein LAZ67_23000870 [Cordylochernes scorpioides]|uniref:Uncharacterized protein n=1 Tax=Cordylochernes scorpioides TaxID=51811 RepID=A0ABY6LQ84_9ARAC|nr:hypothetical protein LAZ67_23000870 [Cordylochernes scorpioides]